MTRTAAEIGAGLAPIRDPRPIQPGEHIHVVGAAGAGASAAALLAVAAGATVSGCDAGGPSTYTPPLVAAGIPLAWEHDPAHVTKEPRPDRLAVTKALTAIAPDHPELVAARAYGIPVEAWQQVVADTAAGQTLVAVAGTHGKSTSAGWLVHVLAGAGVDPSAFVGAILPADLTGGVPATARRGRGSVFVVEADEYAGNFDPYRPSIAIVTSAEWDHPDVFADRDAVVHAFESWLRRAATGAMGTADPPPVLVANVGDAGVAALVERLSDWPGRIVTTSLADGTWPIGSTAARAAAAGPGATLTGRIVAATPTATRLEIAGPDLLPEPLEVDLLTAGQANASNALGVAGAALELGVSAEDLGRGLAGFAGVGRRLERKGMEADVVVYDDYGHHPTAIRKTIAAVRQREPGRRVWAVYEPLTYHRTAAFLEAFAEALATADAVAIADIWAGRDPDTSVASASALAAAVARLQPGIPAAAPGSVEATADWLAGEVRPRDAVLVMGGGRSYVIGERLLANLARTTDRG
ncbi:MAG TPA: cyanophycin synthetase [Candidatus Limnocylindrales bacterium]